uniref:Reverse transcriptase zinc-binding domain-containing protein n=1 Tax=Setaria viridis TaxID=4556 RepID=A0A4U6VUS4_SETVI|nr:hypothetical protein SEVIR_2G256200v2 [Setaria viridis]
METGHHLLAECRYTRRIWDQTATWLAQPNLRPNAWRPSSNALEWWATITTTPDSPRKALRSLILLIMWEVWKERNARIFNRHETSPTTLMMKIKDEASAWLLARAKDLAILLSRE